MKVPASTPSGFGEHEYESRDRPGQRWTRGVVSHRYLILGAAAAIVLLAASALGLRLHADLLKTAFNIKDPTGAKSAGDANLATDVSKLANDGRYILIPSVSLAGAIGAIFWAVGSRRGPGIVGGAIIAGVLGGGLTVIIN